MNDRQSDKYKMARELGMLSSIPILLAVSPLVGYFIGKTVDGWLGTHPWFTYGMLLVGFAAGIRETILIIRKASRETPGSKEGPR